MLCTCDIYCTFICPEESDPSFVVLPEVSSFFGLRLLEFFQIRLKDVKVKAVGMYRLYGPFFCTQQHHLWRQIPLAPERLIPTKRVKNISFFLLSFPFPITSITISFKVTLSLILSPSHSTHSPNSLSVKSLRESEREVCVQVLAGFCVCTQLAWIWEKKQLRGIQGRRKEKESSKAGRKEDRGRGWNKVRIRRWLQESRKYLLYLSSCWSLLMIWIILGK